MLWYQESQREREREREQRKVLRPSLWSAGGWVERVDVRAWGETRRIDASRGAGRQKKSERGGENESGVIF